MLFCLNPPHSLPFPHWPDGATLPAAAAADVSLVALAPPAPTSLPQAHCSSARTLQSRRGGCKLTGTHGACTVEGLGGGDGRKGSGSYPPRLKTPGPRAGQSPGSRGFPFLSQLSWGETRGLALKKEQEILFTAGGEEPFEPLFGKSASPAPAAMCSW